jgi:AcrR family transcriptional regulator
MLSPARLLRNAAAYNATFPMTQEERSERSRAAILEAALQMFSRQGFRGTSIRDVAARAGVSTGSVYHHFRDKEALLNTLLEQFWAAIGEPDFPMNRALSAGAFPTRVEELGNAAREVVTEWRQHIALIYVDVVEFEGLHIRKFYASLASRCEEFMEQHRQTQDVVEQLRPNLPPAAAMLMAMRIFYYYFIVEILFGVPDHYGLSADEAIDVISKILKNGMLKPAPAS